MKQTAVEWLLDILGYNENMLSDVKEIIEQAKAMEKKQIIEAYDKGEFNQGCNGDAEQYYSDVFKISK